MKESQIQTAILLQAGRMGIHLFRNNVGTSKTSDGGHIRFGLCRGSSDLIGWTSTGKFLAVEVKTERGKTTKHQEAFLKSAINSGCVAGVCTSVDDFIRLVDGK